MSNTQTTADDSQFSRTRSLDVSNPAPDAAFGKTQTFGCDKSEQMARMRLASTPESRQQAIITRQEARSRRDNLGFPGMARSIRLKCLDCSGQQVSYVKDCNITACSLWPFRMGRNPKAEDLWVAEINHLGEVVGHHDYEAVAMAE